MADLYERDAARDDAERAQRPVPAPAEVDDRSAEQTALDAPAPTTVMRRPARSGRGQSAAQQGAVLRMQALYGNQIVQRAVQRSSAPAAPAADDELGGRIAGATGTGSRLQPDVRQQLEQGLSADFSGVRVHNDAESDRLARDVDAVAFTTGSDIFFRSGAYAPEAPGGMELLAHEAAHVVQQAAGPVAGTPVAGGVQLSDPADRDEQAADRTSAQVMDRLQAPAAPGAGAEPAAQRRAADAATSGETVAIQRQPPQTTDPGTAPDTGQTPGQTPGQGQGQPAEQEINPDDIWAEIERQARPELLTKLQEIAAAAGEQTRQQIEALFGPYEDSLQSDQTFASIAAIGPWAAAGAAGAAGATAGGLAGGAAQGAGAVFSWIMATNKVSEAKERARSDTGTMVRNQMSSASDLYNNFEAEALDQIRTEFDTSWAGLNPDMKRGSQAQTVTKPLYIAWFRGIARMKYGADSADGRAALGAVRSQAASGLEPVKAKLDEIKASQEHKRIGVGIVGGALLGGTIGTFIAPGIGTAIGAGIGAVVGGIAGWLW